jgi:hypothetical protein
MLFAVFFLLVTSCDDTTDYWYEINETPVITLRKYNNGSYTNNLYDSLKLGFRNYEAQYIVVDSNETTISYNYQQGFGNVTINEIVNAITINADSLGVHIINFNALDILNKEGSAILTLEVFNNLAPVCLFDVTNRTDYEVFIDASNSYDADSKFGGEIQFYKYKIGSFETSPIELSSIYYQFSNAGSYQIKVSVQDNNGVWSEINTQTITVV